MTIATVLVAVAAALAAALGAASWLWLERRTVRRLIDAGQGQPTPVALKRLLRFTVHRDELSGALFSREALLEASPLPAVVLGSSGRVLRANGAARVAFPGLMAGAWADEVAPGLSRALDDVLDGPPVSEVELPDGGRRVFRARLRSYPNGTDRAAVCVLDDVTDDVSYREARRLFSAAVSHELRTPLQRILGLVETLGLPVSRKERDETVRQAEHEVQNLRELIDEMLLLAAIDRDGGALPAGECDAGAVAEGIVRTREERAAEAGMTLRLSTAPGLDVPVAQRLLEVVVGNVVDNAIRYAGPGAEVTVAVTGLAGEVEIAVRDTGVGIAREHLPHVFERFFRGDASRSSGGSGLGLALVKHIVEAHGGRVTAESSPGAGTTVRLVLAEAGAFPNPPVAPLSGSSGRSPRALAPSSSWRRSLARAHRAGP